MENDRLHDLVLTDIPLSKKTRLQKAWVATFFNVQIIAIVSHNRDHLGLPRIQWNYRE
jgi:hypothetical protein